MLDLIEDIKTKRVVEPPKRWRNWWRAITQFECDDTKEVFEIGDLVEGLDEYPFKELAETAAAETVEQNLRLFGFQASVYIGAFPEGERPNG